MQQQIIWDIATHQNCEEKVQHFIQSMKQNVNHKCELFNR